jgi:hypothetical protein
MSQINSEDAAAVVSPDVATDADALIAKAIQPLLDLGLPKDSKLTSQIRPLARDLLIELNPQDAIERMLAVQMIAAFSRSMFLSRHANNQTHFKWFSLYSGECDRAMTLFRRQLQTLQDLRRPRRSFTAIRQANIAGQQIVITDPASAPSSDEKSIQATQASLPPKQSRPCRVAQKRQKKPPLAT